MKPSSYVATDLRALELTDLVSKPGQNASGILRRITVLGGRIDGRSIELETDALGTLRFRRDQSMTFGSGQITVGEYIKRVVDSGDLVDVALIEGVPSHLWISIEYEDGAPLDPNGATSTKDDGLFAMRARSGEKAERRVRRKMTKAGHHLEPNRRIEPGPVRIYLEGKQKRDSDIRCTRCGKSVEVKKRNRDRRFRVSHSDARPFSLENRSSDTHAFVFPDNGCYFVTNDSIMEAITRGRAVVRRDRYDSWADLSATDLDVSEDPPECTPTA